MNDRQEERCYGPEIRFNDWKADGGKLVSAGGGLHIFAEHTACVTRSDYPYGGGGDVAVALTFNFERLGENGAITAHFNRQRDGGGGFRVSVDARHVTVYHKDRQILREDSPSLDITASHRLKLVTLGESFAVYMDDRCLAEGDMEPPFTENEGWMALIVRDADVRLIDFEEIFMVHEVTFRNWRRAELRYEEAFGQASFSENWVCNGVMPKIRDDAFVFRHMGNSVLKHRVQGPIAVEFEATPMPTPDFSAGVTDAIFIWMIDNPAGDLFETMRAFPDAALKRYMPLPLYWVDFGGTNNVTTRLRKNPGRHMIRQFTDRARLLARNRSYRITLVQNGHVLEFWVDGHRWIQAYDPTPLTQGYIGFRAFVADLTVSNLKIWQIES